ncbi:MAG: FimV family protein [Coleofasciculus sp.]
MVRRSPEEQKAFLQQKLDQSAFVGYNGLNVAVNVPQTPPTQPVQEQSTDAGLEDNAQQPEVWEAEATETQEEETIQPKEGSEAELSQNPESPDTEVEGEAVTPAQPSAAESENNPSPKPNLQAQKERILRLSSNLLTVPVNTQRKESSPVQRNGLQNGLRKDKGNQLDNDKSISERRTERRTEREVESDRRRRRPEGGTGGGGHLESDWAGRSILYRYLTGGGDWHINSDPNWSSYMKANESLQQTLQSKVLELAKTMGTGSGNISETFHVSIENGESIVGYQYLHGTNANVGDFQITGNSSSIFDAGGTKTITLDLAYTWNDVIDPNPQYTTDNIKSLFAERITLGRAETYTIHITWSSQSIVEIDASGNVISSEGWPFN